MGEALVEEVEPMMLKDLAQVAGFAPAQAHAYLVSFRKTGLVEQDADTGRYRLGRFALDLGITSMRATDPMALAGDAITELSERTALHVALVVWGSFGPTVVSVKESGGQLNMNTRPGTVYSMAGTASGRIFTAFLPDAIVRDAIASEKRERAGHNAADDFRDHEGKGQRGGEGDPLARICRLCHRMVMLVFMTAEAMTVGMGVCHAP